MSDKNIEKNGVNLERLRKLIDTKTREEIARRLECDTSLVTKHYNGKREVTAEYVAKYAKYFGVSADYLLGMSEHKTPIDALGGEIIRTVCDYTGLNEQAIEELHSIASFLLEATENYEFDDTIFSEKMFYDRKEYLSNKLSFISYCLTSKKFVKVVEDVLSYKENMSDRTEKINNSISSKDIYFSGIEFSSNVRLYYFEAIESIKELVNLYCEEVFSEYKKAENKKRYINYKFIEKISKMASPLIGEAFVQSTPMDGTIFNVDTSAFSAEEIAEMDLIINEVLNNANDNEAE